MKTFDAPQKPKPKIHKRAEDRAVSREGRRWVKSSRAKSSRPTRNQMDDLAERLSHPAPAVLTMCGLSPVALNRTARLTDDWEAVTCRLCLRSRPRDEERGS